MSNVDFTEQINNFRSAKYGEDVRESLIEIAESVEDACNNQLITVDETLEESGQGADAAVVGQRLEELESAISSSQGLTAEFKTALENFAKAVAFKGDDPTGQTYIDALVTAMNPPANLLRISAVYEQSGNVYTTDTLDSLKADLVVTAYYDNSPSEVIENYTLSGTLAEGTSTITVTYGGKTATFNVIVTERGALYPLENGTWESATTNPVYRITISNGNHVKFEVLRNVSQQAFADLHNGGMSSQPSLINNLQELFVIPANTETTFSISNVVNTNGVTFNCNFRKANATTSSSFGIGDGTHTDGATVTQTLDADESVGCAFFYHVAQSISSGSVVEFDLSLIVGGARYI